MSIIKAFGEYLDMVKTGFKNRDKILEAMQISAQIKNKDDHSEISNEAIAEILRRKDICAECPFNSRNGKQKGTYTSSLPYEHCTLCKCRIGYDDSKEFCLSCNCGAESWNEAHPKLKPIEVRWKSFEDKK